MSARTGSRSDPNPVNCERLVVPAQRLVGPIALLEGEAREEAPEPEDGVVGLAQVVGDVLLHDREPPRLDARAVQVPELEVVEHVERVDEELLVGRRLVLAARAGEHVLADRVLRVVREVEHVDGLVGRLEVALRAGRTAATLCWMLPRSSTKRALSLPMSAGKLGVDFTSISSSSRRMRLARLALVERRAHGQHPLGVRRAPLERGDRGERDERDEGLCDGGRERGCPHRSALVT